VPLAFLLPPIKAEPRESSAAPKRWIPSPLNILFFVVSFTADGVMGTTYSVLLADFMPVSAAIVSAGLLGAANRFIGITLAFASGPTTDRVGAHRLLLPCTLVIVAGFLIIASGHVLAGALVVMVARALLATAGPVLAAERSTDRIAALATYSTWTDIGLGGGAFLGAVGIAKLGAAPTYSLMALALLLTTIWQFRVSRKSVAA
jgi:hypothetical protein